MKHKPALVAILGILVAFLTLEGTSWAPVQRRANPMDEFIKYIVVSEWTWFSPLEGVNYDMNQFEDGTIVALHRPKDLQRLKEMKLEAPSSTSPRDLGPNKTHNPRDYLPDHTEVVQENTRIILVQAAYELWTQSGIRCKARLNATDIIGNKYEICKTAPFRFATPYGKVNSDSNKEEVWIIIPPASGKREPARRGTQPSWGR